MRLTEATELVLVLAPEPKQQDSRTLARNCYSYQLLTQVIHNTGGSLCGGGETVLVYFSPQPRELFVAFWFCGHQAQLNPSPGWSQVWL